MHSSISISGATYNFSMSMIDRHEHNNHKWFYHGTHVQTFSVTENVTPNSMYVSKCDTRSNIRAEM